MIYLRGQKCECGHFVCTSLASTAEANRVHFCLLASFRDYWANDRSSAGATITSQDDK